MAASASGRMRPAREQEAGLVAELEEEPQGGQRPVEDEAEAEGERLAGEELTALGALVPVQARTEDTSTTA